MNCAESLVKDISKMAGVKEVYQEDDCKVYVTFPNNSVLEITWDVGFFDLGTNEVEVFFYGHIEGKEVFDVSYYKNAIKEVSKLCSIKG